MSEIWFLIPARGGSKAIPKKNVRLLKGKPLVTYVLDTIGKLANKDRIIVSTDDDEIKGLVQGRAIIHDRSERNANDLATLDDVALEVVEHLMKHGAHESDILLTVQPTSPFLKVDTLQKAIRKFNSEAVDTVLTVKDDRHLRWTLKNDNPQPQYTARVNRQEIAPTFAETGGIIGSTIDSLIKKKTRISDNVALIEVGDKEGLDIDTYEDWARAEFWCNRLRIFIRVDGSKNMGFGHLYRALALAQNLTSHEVFFVTNGSGEFKIGQEFLSAQHFPLLKIFKNGDIFDLVEKFQPQIFINDILDTEESYVKKLQNRDLFVVNFEDLGPGSKLADVVINDLYPDLYPQNNHWYGIENAILNPNFEIEDPREIPKGDVEHILIAYGGTDPSNLTLKALQALRDIDYGKKITVVLGPGNQRVKDVKKNIEGLNADVTVLQNVKNMAKVMKKADLALTSAGRTVTELMSLGVPTIATCQNTKEMRHNHATGSYGVVNLGLGNSIGPEVLAEHINIYLDDVQMRRDMYCRMISATKDRSNSTIVSNILSEYKRLHN